MEKKYQIIDVQQYSSYDIRLAMTTVQINIIKHNN